MASTRTRTKTIRLANESADFYEKMPLNRIAECTHQLLESGKLKFDGSDLKIVSENGVHTEKNAEIVSLVSEMDEMAGCCGVPLEDMVHQFFGMLEDGRLSFENGVMRANCEPWVEEFKSVCHDLCIPVEKAAESAIKALKRGSF